MDQKAKFIIVGLIGITVISFFLYIQAFNSKQTIQRERDDLKSENSVLGIKIEKIQIALSENQDKIKSLNTELGKVSQEKAELDKKYELATKEREELIQKLKSRPPELARVPMTVTEQQPQPTEAQPQATDAYWAGILKVKTDLELRLESITKELRVVQVTNEQLEREKVALNMDLQNLKNEKEDLKRQVDYNQKVTDSLSQELVRERNDKIMIQDNLKAIKSQNTILLRQLRSLTARKVTLDSKLKELQENKTSLERRFQEMETMLTNKITQIDNFKEQLDIIRRGGKPEAGVQPPRKESVELPPIFVRPQSAASLAQEVTSLVGKILTVDRENNFAIVDLGEDVGMKLGDSLRVYRKGEQIANLEVIKTNKSVSACDVKNEVTPVAAGDIVR